MNTDRHEPGVELATPAEIRSHFPALERRHHGLPVAYFDGPGGTQVPRQVAAAVTDYLFHHNANTHWAYPASAETDEIIRAAREAMSDFLGAAPGEIVFGANMTTLTFHFSRALGPRFSPGDEIITTELDHHANIDPWRRLATERGLTLRTVRMVPETGQLDWEDFARCLDGRPRLVALGAASNALGTINDVARAAALARAAGALLFVDAVHYAPHVLTDVRALGCDFLACSAYKFHGPHMGVLYGRGELLGSLSFPKLQPASDEAPERAETGTLNHEGIAGTGAAVDFLASLSRRAGTRRERLAAVFAGLHAQSAALFGTLWEGLARLPGLKLYGPPPGAARTPTVAFTVREIPAEEVARRLAERALFVSHGDFYATTAVRRLGLADRGLVRVGCAAYTTAAEIERLLEAVGEIAGERSLV